MFVWSILLAVIFYPRNDGGLVDSKIQITATDAEAVDFIVPQNENPPVIQCHNYRITRYYNGSVHTSPITNETCNPGRNCIYSMNFLEKESVEYAECYTIYEKSGISISYDDGYNSEGDPYYHKYEFSCDADFCNTKENPIYEKLQELLNLTNVKWEILNQEHKKQGNETLFCYKKEEKDGKDVIRNVRCSGTCFHSRENHHERDHRDYIKKRQECREDRSFPKDFGPIRISVRAQFGEGTFRIWTYFWCSYNNCNEEGSIADKFHDEARDILSEYDTVTMLPPTPCFGGIVQSMSSTSFSMASTLPVPLALILMVMVYI